MNMPPPMPLPVQPLNYEAPQYNSWTMIVRLLGIIGLFLGVFTIVDAILPFAWGTSWGRMGSSMWVVWLAAAGVGLVAGTAGIVMIVASAQFLRRIDGSVLMQVSMVALVCLGILRGALWTVLVYLSMSTSAGTSKVHMMASMASNMLYGLHTALLPLLVTLVVGIGKKDVMYQAVFRKY